MNQHCFSELSCGRRHHRRRRRRRRYCCINN